MPSLPTLSNRKNGTITAVASSSKLADGAAALVLLAGDELAFWEVVVIVDIMYLRFQTPTISTLQNL